MPALIRRHGNRIRILLNCSVYDFLHASVVAQVNHLNARGLNDASHDVYRRIVTVEQ